jgi:hypothetical protein
MGDLMTTTIATAPTIGTALESEGLDRLTRDLRAAARTLTPDEARYLVDGYYTIQGQRIRIANQVRAASEDAEPHEMMLWLRNGFQTFELDTKKALQAYAESSVPGRWAMSIVGIGPVIAAGMLAHIDITRARTAGAIWRFAGLDPTVRWGKGEKRPWNADLKVLCWKTGDSFVKVSGRADDVYGHVYRERKAYELERDARGGHEATAVATLEARTFKDAATKRLYESGHLPAGRLDLRARRYAVKLFLAHLHHVMYEEHYGEPPPRPYVIEHGGHTHYIAPPNWPLA